VQIEHFADAFFFEALRSKRIPGAVFVVVDRESVRFARGYGFEDVELGVPMDPATTRVRVGSLSKFVTATAVMQQVERGVLSLHRDVNEVLRLPRLNSKYAQPVTLHHLLTHTAGIDARVIGTFAREDAAAESLASHLKQRLPSRIMPPGEVIRYSNYGFALAGYLLEVASGTPFPEYVEQNLLITLAMHRSGFLVSGEPPPQLAIGYEADQGALRRVPSGYFLPLPAGGFTTTALDISRLMRAHLSDGRLGTTRILSPESVQRMHAQQFTHAPELPGVTYGLWERFENGQRALQHGGAWNGYSCLMVLLPEPGLGFFVAYNQFDLGLAQTLAADFLDAFFPSPTTPAAVGSPGSASVDVASLAGAYRDNWYSKSELDKLQSIFWQVEVRPAAGGGLLVDSPMDPTGPSRWQRAGPLRFDNVADDRMLAFGRDANGDVSHLFIGSSAYERIPWFETARTHELAIAPIMLLLASAILRGTVRGSRATGGTGGRDRFWVAAAGIAAIQLVLLAGFLSVMVGVARSGGWSLGYGVTPAIEALLALGVLACAGGVALPAATLGMAVGRRHSWGSVAHYGAVAIAAASLAWLVVFYNLVGFA